jgi:protease-4
LDLRPVYQKGGRRAQAQAGYVETIAQGRVWSGKEALKLGLVDEIGGLHRAIGYALRKAKVAQGFRLVEYPEKKTLADMIAEIIGRVQPEASSARTPSILAQAEKRLENELRELKAFNDPQGIYARLPMEVAIH